MSELIHEIEKIETEIEKMQKQLNRAKELNKLLGDNPTHADVSCETSWILHSDLTPVAIIDKIKGE